MGPIIITGGAGFIGSNLAHRALAATDAPVVVFDKLTYAGHRESLADLAGEPRFSFVQGDIADGAAVRRLIQDVRPAALVNLAAESHVDRSIDDAEAFIRTNVAGTRELLDAVRGLPSDFRFVQVSTDEVYGSLGPTGSFTESTPFAPRSPYAATKAAADHLCAAWHATFGIPVIVTGCSNNFGPYQFPEKLLPHVLLNALEAKPLPIYGDGLYVRDWIFVEDHCDGILAALRSGRVGERYNFGGANEMTNLALVDALLAELERQAPARDHEAMRARGLPSYAALKTFVPDRPGHDRRYSVDASKAQRELGWRPRKSFAEALATTVRWYLANAAWCGTVQRNTDARVRRGVGA